MALLHHQIEPAPYEEDFITEHYRKNKPVDAREIVRRLPHGVKKFMESGVSPQDAPAALREFMAERDLIKVDGRLGRVGPMIYTQLGKQVVAQVNRQGRGNL